MFLFLKDARIISSQIGFKNWNKIVDDLGSNRLVLGFLKFCNDKGVIFHKQRPLYELYVKLPKSEIAGNLKIERFYESQHTWYCL